MSESVQSNKENETLENYAFGVVCNRCGRPAQSGRIWLKPSAQLADLRNADAQELQLGTFADCEYFDPSGRVCGEATSVTRDSLVFVGYSPQERDTPGDFLSPE